MSAGPAARTATAFAAWLVATAAAFAQTAGPGPAKVEDTMAQRVLACTGCHGKEGRAASDGYYPRIAGKPAGYLYNQLLNFRDGRRRYVLMGKLLAPLDDAYLREIADHFAALDLPYPPLAAGGVDPAMLQRGERLVRQGDPARRLPACVQCHGDAMTGIAPAVPGLLGLPRDYLAAQLGAWRTGQRVAQAPDCMAQVAKQLAPDEIGALAQWLAAQPVPAQQAKALPERGATPWPLPCGGVP
jgi:cytochrome c553